MNAAEIDDLARQLGYSWPADDESRQRVLLLMAQMAANWRSKVEDCQRETWPKIESERLYKHMERRNRNLSRKLANVRLALRDYMKQQAAFVREGYAEIRRHRSSQRLLDDDKQQAGNSAGSNKES